MNWLKTKTWIRWLWDHLDPVVALLAAAIATVLGFLDVVGRQVVDNVTLFVLAVLALSLVRERSGREQVQQSLTDLSSSIVRAPGFLAAYGHLSDINWRRYFETSSDVVLIARFFDGIVGTVNLRDVFRRNGTITVITTDPNSTEALRVAHEQRNPAGGALYDEDVKTRLLAGLRMLENARHASSASSDQLKVYFAPHPLNYVAYCFDRSVLLYSPYEHAFLPESRAPKVEIDLRKSDVARKFWLSEVKWLCNEDNRALDLAELLRQSRVQSKPESLKEG